MPDSDQGLANLVSQLKAGVTNLSSIAQTLSIVFPRVAGSFTLSAGTTTAVAQPGILGNGTPWWVPTNAAAAMTLMTNGLYLAVVTAGVGFSVSTGTGTPSGTATFNYVVFNPV